MQILCTKIQHLLRIIKYKYICFAKRDAHKTIKYCIKGADPYIAGA